AMDPVAIEKVITKAIEEMQQQGIHGKQSTPFLLSKIAQVTQGESLAANIQLVLNNARLGADIAVELAKLSSV
ncbi:MAG: pseudouridine-5-phosphate glycosidase, partial [Oceanospirillaceae bacterium]|nr:pseudouridine-5-phosphate glycosidase [Oceanospirillaceae bacterium]